MRESDFERCEADAAALDDARARARTCQRELDAASGAEGILRVQIIEERERVTDLEVERARIEEERDKRWTVRRVVGTVVLALVAGYAGGRVHQWVKGR